MLQIARMRSASPKRGRTPGSGPAAASAMARHIRVARLGDESEQITPTGVANLPEIFETSLTDHASHTTLICI